LWLKVEAGGNYRKTTFLSGKQPNFEHSILAGPEFKLRRDSKLVPWAHVLAGITMHNHPVATFNNGGLTFLRKTDVRFGFQPGGGIDYYFSPKIGLRLGADYRRAIENFNDENFFRAQGGIILRFGGK
jgi:hypothetical protein